MFERQILEGVSLALLEDRHAAEVFAVVDRDRAYLREWLPWVDANTGEEQTQTFIRTSLEQFANNNGFSAGIWSGEEFAGVIGTHKIDWLNRRVEIGYWIASNFQGRGIVTAACRALLDHAFRHWKLNRVEIHCATANEKSCAVARRLGFQFEGILRESQLLNGKYFNTGIYSILASEWEEVGEWAAVK